MPNFEEVLSTQQVAMKNINKAISSLLSEYNKKWGNDESQVEESRMTNADYYIYTEMFKARDSIREITVQIHIMMKDH